jgi:hypothetical protein
VEDHQALTATGGLSWVSATTLLAASLTAFCLGCADNPELPDAYDRPLVPIAVYPPLTDEPISLNQTFVLTFNTYVDLDPLTYWNTVSIASGGVTAFGPTSYRMVDRQIVLRTTRTMEPDLTYQLLVNAEVLRSVTGQPYAGPLAFTYRTGDAFEDDPPEPGPLPVWADVAPIFAACNGCHADPEWKLEPLTVDTMVAVPSKQVANLHIIEPYVPSKSYLMHKVLWDYPLREQSAQPPAWAGYPQLSVTDQRLLEEWILAGAKEVH